MISTFTAVIDSNVFYGARLRSLVLFAAQTKLFRARWTDEITEEWVRNLLKKRPDISRDQLQSTIDALNNAVENCIVEGYEDLIPAMKLPDDNDRHVLAAAVRTCANVIVTFNTKDFPEDELAKYGIKAIDPDVFLIDTFQISPPIMIEAIANDFKHYQNPEINFDDYREALSRSGCKAFAKLLERYEVLVDGDSGD